MANPLIDSFRAILQSAPLVQGQPSLIPGIRAGTNAGDIPRPQQQPQQSAQLPSNINAGAMRQQFAEQQGQQPQSGGFKFNPEVLKLLIPALTAGVGTAFPGALAGASGFQTGFTGEIGRQREQEADLERLVGSQIMKDESEERKRQQASIPTDFELEKEARIRATQLFDPISPPSAEEYADAINEMKSRLQSRASESLQSDESFSVPKGAPSAEGKPDGSKLKDSTGKVVAISRNGQWVSQ